MRRDILSTPRVLIVDDDVTLCNSLKDFLSHQYSDITCVNGGNDAIKFLNNKAFDVVLLDLVMPDMHGSQVMEFINREKPETFVIVMTGYSSIDSAINALRKGVYDYLNKPFDLEKLTTTVGNAVRTKRLEDEGKRTQEALRIAHEELEKRVEKRTAELIKANEKLRHEVERRKRAEEALRKAHEELEIRVQERTTELAEANEGLRNEILERKRVEELLRTTSHELRLFAYSVIHDLKSPAVGVYGLTKLLHQRYKNILDENGQHYCEQILKAAEHIAALIDKINVYIATKEGHLKIERINVKEILHLVKEEFANRLSFRQIKWMEPDNIPVIRADRLSMVRAYRNFVDNALKHGGNGLSEISLGYEESHDFHILSVSDNGVGMQEQDSERFFSPFQRDEKSSLVEGAGLGLAIVREIAERHAGKVWVNSFRDRGTKFCLSISREL